MRQLSLIILIFAVGVCNAQTDTVTHETVEIKASRNTFLKNSLNKQTIEAVGAVTLSDALKFIPGVIIKDYGGIGGVKTVNYRSVGSQQGMVSFDNVPMQSAQTGVTDFSIFITRNIKSVSVSQTGLTVQPAKLLVSGFTVNIQTDANEISRNDGDSVNKNISLSAKYGSYNTGEICINSEIINAGYKINIAADYNHSDGDYKYKLTNGDSTGYYHRQNGRTDQMKYDLSISSRISPKIESYSKIFGYMSKRGLPKATTYYNLESDEILKDNMVFCQSKLRLKLSEKSEINQYVKYSFSGESWRDPDYNGINSSADYYQHEIYESTVMSIRPLSEMFLGIAADYDYNILKSDNVSGRPARHSFYLSASGEYKINKYLGITAVTAVQKHYSINKQSTEQFGGFNPSAGIEIGPFEFVKLNFDAKHTFRLPSFNDLYYNGIGSRILKPERANLYSLSSTFFKTISKTDISIKADIYNNSVKDKIVAVPTKNIYIWTMYNVGRTDIKAVEISGMIKTEPFKKLKIELSGTHTYQRAIDLSDKNSSVYKNQIAYVPRVSGSFLLKVEYRDCFVSYALNHQGRRYCLGENIAQNSIPAYCDQTVVAGYSIKKLSFTVEFHNVAGVTYEIIKNFPMPGLSFYSTIKYEI